jgi:hypothetical protein
MHTERVVGRGADAAWDVLGLGVRTMVLGGGND